MKIFLVKDGEPLPIESPNVRLLRTGIMAKYFASFGHEVVWFSSAWCHAQKMFYSSPAEVVSLSEKLKLHLVESCGYPRNISFKRIRHYKILANNVVKAFDCYEKPDVIIVSFPAIELANSVVLYGQHHNIPVYVDVRDMWPDIIYDLFPIYMRKLASLVLSSMYRKTSQALSTCTGIISITDSFLDWSLQYASRNKNKNDYVLPLVNKPQAGYLNEDMERYWAKLLPTASDHKLVIGFVGSLSGTMPLFEAINVAKKYTKDVLLVIAGTGELFDSYSRLAESSKNIVMTGWIDGAKIAYFLDKIVDVGLAPYIKRKDFCMSLPNKTIEYLSYGVPILTSLSGELSRLIEAHNVGQVYKQEGLDSAVVCLLKEKTLVSGWSKNAKTLYMSDFYPDRLYSQFCKFLDSALSCK